MIQAILIDDEKNALEMLEWQLHTYCPQVSIVALCNNANDAIAAIKKHQPQLVFLDIEMPKKNGFEVLLAFDKINFEVIFTTAYDQFAIKAIKFAALDFLLKPIDADDLITAINRYENSQQSKNITAQLQQLLQQYKQPQTLPEKIAFSTSEGVIFIKPSTIIYCEATSNYTHIFFTDGTKMVVSKTLKDVEEMLLEYHFYRAHNSYLINLAQVKKYVKTDGGIIEMSNAAQLPISRQKKDGFVQILLNATQ